MTAKHISPTGNNPAAARILKYCLELAEPVTTAQVAAALGLHPGTTTNAIVMMTQRGELYKCTGVRHHVTYSAYAHHVVHALLPQQAAQPQNVAHPREKNIFGEVYTPARTHIEHARPGCTNFLAVPSRTGDARSQYRPPRFLCD